MAINSTITSEDEWFLGESKELDFVIYVTGTTAQEIMNNPSGNRQDISGWEFRWTLREEIRDAAIITKSTGEVIVTNSSAGELSITIPAGDTDDLVPGKYFHSLARVDVGSETELSYGYVVLKGPAI